MIKINLLPQKRAKRTVAVASTGDGGGKQFALGVGAVVAAAAVVFLVVDMPKRSERSELETKTRQLQAEIAQKKKNLEGYDAMKAGKEAAEQKIQSINRLLTAKVVPANVLHELGQILSVRGPTMTEQMSKLVDPNSTTADPNKKIQQDWDPQHVWLTSFIDQAGEFRLEGGAQSKEDVTQLSKRLAASVYFEQVTPQSGDRVNDKDSGLSYYKFTITGKVAY